MRLWHYRLIHYLPKSQLIAQWRELNSIYVKQDKHILINYIYEYPKYDLEAYSNLVVDEMKKRGIKVNLEKGKKYFNDGFTKIFSKDYIPFKKHHTDRYLIQCYYNLQEKFDRGQKDFLKHQMMQIYQLVRDDIGIPILEVK